jgi:hypothetical protein
MSGIVLPNGQAAQQGVPIKHVPMDQSANSVGFAVMNPQGGLELFSIGGMTHRLHAAITIAAGMAGLNLSAEEIAEKAVERADAVIAETAKPVG